MRLRVALFLCAIVSRAAADEAPFPQTAPYFGELPATAALNAGKWQEARDGYAAARDKTQDPAARDRLGFLVAWCDRKLGRWADAAAGFDAAADKLPLLADYARYEAAVADYHLRHWDAADTRARAVSEGAVLYAEAQLVLGDVLRARGDADAIAAHYSAYLARYPDGIRVAEARFWLAQAEEKRGHIPD